MNKIKNLVKCPFITSLFIVAVYCSFPMNTPSQDEPESDLPEELGTALGVYKINSDRSTPFSSF
ncbi:MAG: hypothetical protein ACT4O9_08925, partial [Blastocatellia bacterium]